VVLAALTLSAADYKAPKTPWGEPDLQGVWSTAGELGVPFERNTAFGDRQLLTDEEFSQRLKQTAAQLENDNAEFNIETANTANARAVGSATSPPPHWLERSETSCRIPRRHDPPDGRIPRYLGWRAAAAPAAGGNGPSTALSRRDVCGCIAGGVPTSIFLQYNANTRIAQAPATSPSPTR
jgi:hypothetical protein